MARLTYSQLIASFPDNNTEQITPANLRDLVDSISVEEADVAIIDGTMSLTAGTPVQVMFDTIVSLTPGMSAADGAVTVAEEQRHDIICQLSFNSDTNNVDIDINVRVNGALLPRGRSAGSISRLDFEDIDVFVHDTVPAGGVVDLMIQASEDCELTEFSGSMLIRSEPLNRD